MERKKNGHIKKIISIRMLVLFYTIQLVIAYVCTKFQIPICTSS